jgi:hypothetical protein
MKSEFTVMKVKCIPEMLGREVLLVTDVKSYKEMKTLPIGKKMFCQVEHGGKHNLERHDLFWACVAIVSSNLGLTDNQVVETCKIDCRWYNGFTHYKDKNGKDRVNVMTKSIRFKEMTLVEANEFYSKAFDILSSYINISIEKLVAEAKERMGV